MDPTQPKAKQVAAALNKLVDYHPKAVEHGDRVSRMLSDGELPPGFLLGLWVACCRQGGLSRQKILQLVEETMDVGDKLSFQEKGTA